MALGLHRANAQKVASVIVPGLKMLEGEERFFFFFFFSGEWRFWYIALCGSFSSPETAFIFLYGSGALST